MLTGKLWHILFLKEKRIFKQVSTQWLLNTGRSRIPCVPRAALSFPMLVTEYGMNLSSESRLTFFLVLPTQGGI